MATKENDVPDEVVCSHDWEFLRVTEVPMDRYKKVDLFYCRRCLAERTKPHQRQARGRL